MDLHTFNNDLLSFLQNSPTPFHAVQTMAARLKAAGYEQLSETDDWQISSRGRYYVVRNGSSIVAFKGGKRPLLEDGLRMVGAHTDSPCIKVKPQPEIINNGYFQLGVEVYGGALLNPWFDRDLSLAGRVSFKTTGGELRSALVDFEQAIATIPSLAIHLDREANKKKSINSQTDIAPILMQCDQQTMDFRQLLVEQLLTQHPECQVEDVLDYELSFYDTQPPAITGFQKEFIASARLDNLLSCYIGLQALLAESDHHCLLVCNDHEEVGSQSAEGAQGPMLRSIIQRIVDNDKDVTRVLQKSFMISVDNAHGIHPNFADRHDGNHGPLLSKGPVIKVNANQRYATNSETSSLFRHWCDEVDEAVQSFVVRTDMACGSTIGPITASGLGVRTLDVGVPTFAMHSIRELAGCNDSYALCKILTTFNAAAKIVIESEGSL